MLFDKCGDVIHHLLSGAVQKDVVSRVRVGERKVIRGGGKLVVDVQVLVSTVNTAESDVV